MPNHFRERQIRIRHHFPIVILTLLIHCGTAETAIHTIRVRGDLGPRSNAHNPRRTVIASSITHNTSHHLSAMGRIYTTLPRLQRRIRRLQCGDPLIGLSSARCKPVFQHRLIRNVRISETRIIGHHLAVNNRDLHTFAGDILLPCVTHAHVIHIPIAGRRISIIGHRNRRTHRTSHHHSHGSTNQTPRVPLHRPALHHKNISQPQEN